MKKFKTAKEAQLACEEMDIAFSRKKRSKSESIKKLQSSENDSTYVLVWDSSTSSWCLQLQEQ